MRDPPGSSLPRTAAGASRSTPHRRSSRSRRRQGRSLVDYIKKHYRLALWLFLSLYLFLSTTYTPTPFHLLLPRRRSTLTLRSRSTTSPAAPPPVRIYIYSLPPRFNSDWLAADARCGEHLFAAEVAIHEALQGFAGRVLDPADADFFFVPVYVSCNFSTANGFPSLAHARPLLAEAVGIVSRELPYWNHSSGRDHIFVASHDFGACFHPMEDVAIADGIPPFLSNSIILQTFGVHGDHACLPAEHIVIPPHVPASVAGLLQTSETSKRDIFVYFRGKMELHPKNISGRFYGKAVRTEIHRLYGKNPRFYLKRKRSDGYRAEIARSVFCLCPRGWAPWSPRLVEAVLLGCVPVVIADGIRLPFDNVVRWHEISVSVPESQIGRLEIILDEVAATNLTTMQQRLREPARRKALVFNRRMEEGDATWQVIKQLEGKLGLSRHRQSQRRS